MDDAAGTKQDPLKKKGWECTWSGWTRTTPKPIGHFCGGKSTANDSSSCGGLPASVQLRQSRLSSGSFSWHVAHRLGSSVSASVPSFEVANIRFRPNRQNNLGLPLCLPLGFASVNFLELQTPSDRQPQPNLEVFLRTVMILCWSVWPRRKLARAMAVLSLVVRRDSLIGLPPRLPRRIWGRWEECS